MKKTLTALAIMGTIGMMGCGGSGNKAEEAPKEPVIKHIDVFKPGDTLPYRSFEFNFTEGSYSVFDSGVTCFMATKGRPYLTQPDTYCYPTAWVAVEPLKAEAEQPLQR